MVTVCGEVGPHNSSLDLHSKLARARPSDACWLRGCRAVSPLLQGMCLPFKHSHFLNPVKFVEPAAAAPGLGGSRADGAGTAKWRKKKKRKGSKKKTKGKVKGGGLEEYMRKAKRRPAKVGGGKKKRRKQPAEKKRPRKS